MEISNTALLILLITFNTYFNSRKEQDVLWKQGILMFVYTHSPYYTCLKQNAPTVSRYGILPGQHFPICD